MDTPTTVIDFADDVARFGYALEGGAAAPSAWIRARVRPRGGGDGARDVVVAVEGGRIADVDALECVVRAGAYDELGWRAGGEGYACVCEPSGTTARAREATTRMMFEEFNVAGLAFLDGATCAMYACGRVSGLAVDVGETGSECACVAEGWTSSATARRIDAGGRAMDAALATEVRRKQGIDLDMAVAREIRLALGKCASTREEYEALARGCATVECEQETFTMPNGTALKLTSELYECGEALMPIVDEMCECIQKCSPDMRRIVLDGVFVHGVASKVSGLEARLLNELKSALPPSLSPFFVTIPEYMPETTWSHAPWTGAALVAKVIFTTNQHISKSDYNENGPPVAHKGRC